MAQGLLSQCFMRSFAISIFVAVTLAAGVAGAQPGMPLEPSQEYAQRPPRWVAPTAGAEISYGRRIALSDGVAAGLMSTALLSGIYCWADSWTEDSGSASCDLAVGSFFGALGTYALVPAIIHVHEGQPAQALGSIAL